MCEMCEAFIDAAPATPPPAEAPSLAEVVAGRLAEIRGTDPLASLCLASSPWVGLVCALPAGHDGDHRSNPIPAMEWTA